MSCVAFSLGEKNAHDQSQSHDELHDEVEICPEGGTGPEEALCREKANSTHPLHSQIPDSQ